MSERVILGRKVEKVLFSSADGHLLGHVRIQGDMFWNIIVETKSPARADHLLKISGWLCGISRDGERLNKVQVTPRLSCVGEAGKKELNEVLAVALPGLAIGKELERGDNAIGRSSVYSLVIYAIGHFLSHSNYN